MSRRRRGGLSDEDMRLWSQVAASAHPLRPGSPPQVAPPELPGATAKPAPKQKAAPSPKAPPPLLPFRVGQAAATAPRAATAVLAPGRAQMLAGMPLRMDHKTHRQMSRGKVMPEARIDLHGMTLAVAQPALIEFILRQQAAGRRLVLVITGKGYREVTNAPLPVRPGALRHYVPHWLARAPMATVVQQIAPAHVRHGGEGAYYVYLRR